jgi:hypothetical protein
MNHRDNDQHHGDGNSFLYYEFVIRALPNGDPNQSFAKIAGSGYIMFLTPTFTNECRS